MWSFDEHRIGLKPIIRKVWAPIGERPSAIVYHRYEGVYLYRFVHPQTGKTELFIIPRVNIEWFNLVLEQFALATGAGQLFDSQLFQFIAFNPLFSSKFHL